MKGNERVVIVRAATLDRHGDPLGPPTETIVEGCIIWPRTTSELNDRGVTVIEGENVFMPAGASVVLPNDRMRLERVGVPARTYDVDGQPADYRTHGRRKGVLVVLKKVGA